MLYIFGILLGMVIMGCVSLVGRYLQHRHERRVRAARSMPRKQLEICEHEHLSADDTYCHDCGTVFH